MPSGEPDNESVLRMLSENPGAWLILALATCGGLYCAVVSMIRYDLEFAVVSAIGFWLILTLFGCFVVFVAKEKRQRRDSQGKFQKVVKVPKYSLRTASMCFGVWLVQFPLLVSVLVFVPEAKNFFDTAFEGNEETPIVAPSVVESLTASPVVAPTSTSTRKPISLTTPVPTLTSTTALTDYQRTIDVIVTSALAARQTDDANIQTALEAQRANTQTATVSFTFTIAAIVNATLEAQQH